jgi:hypothetical protein
MAKRQLFQKEEFFFTSNLFAVVPAGYTEIVKSTT